MKRIEEWDGNTTPLPRIEDWDASPPDDDGSPARGIVAALLIELLLGGAIGLALATWIAWVAGWI